MEMPKSIKLFEQLFFGVLALGVINGALMWSEMGLSGGAAYRVAGFQVLIMVIVGALVLLTSRKKSVICKWITTIFFVLGMVMFIPNLATFFEQGLMGVISAVQVLMQAYAIYLLFNADSKAWFASKKLADS
tara:strand:- start:770 stop:1165 length:396 start_codon:yes stop_codon:yes gene_type:complete